MIAYLKGTLEEVGDDYLILEVQGIGYQVRTPARILEELGAYGSLIKIYTYTYVREDTLALYGFLTREDLSMFGMLLGVSGIGPKAALAILSLLTSSQLKLAILSQDVKTISKTPGIGAKTAQRMLIDLKGKVSLEDSLPEMASLPKDPALSPSGFARSDAIEALIALGYSSSESLKAVSAVELTEEMDSEAILKAALKKMI